MQIGINKKHTAQNINQCFLRRSDQIKGVDAAEIAITAFKVIQGARGADQVMTSTTLKTPRAASTCFAALSTRNHGAVPSAETVSCCNG